MSPGRLVRIVKIGRFLISLGLLIAGQGAQSAILHVALWGALLGYAKTFDALGISFLINVKEISDLFPAHLQGNPSKGRFLQVPIRMKTPLIERNI